MAVSSNSVTQAALNGTFCKFAANCRKSGVL
jgi:hypothetical protein